MMNLDDIQRLYRDALDASSEQRNQIEEDLAFSDPSDPQQWDEAERQRRMMDPGGARPCLVYDQIGQYVANVAGQVESSPPGLHAIPVDSGADKKVAEALDGHFRHIEHASRAQAAYQTAYTSAARTGVGYLVVRPTVVDESLRYQEPRISGIGDPLRVVLDPWSTELDGSDADSGFILTPFSAREFKRRWKDKAAVSFGDIEAKERDERESIIVAEAWTREEQRTTMVEFAGLTGDRIVLPEDDFLLAQQRSEVAEVTGTRTETRRRVWWRMLSGADVLEVSRGLDGKEAPFPADSIGIVPMYGYVGYRSGRLTYCGLPRRARSAQQAYNYHRSEERALLAQIARAPYIMPMSALGSGDNIKRLWDRASVEARAYLPYEDWDAENNRPVTPPQRNPLAINLANHQQGAADALRDIQSALGLYQANLGAPSNETSGVAIESRKQQGEASTAHFQSHGAASIAQVGRLCADMLVRLVDTPRRLRTLGVDSTPSSVRVDPQQAEAVQETGDGLSINPSIGRYDVRVVVGAAYSTQRNQTRDALNEVMARNPALAAAIAPLWARTLDVPDADKLAQVLTAVAPPPVQAVLKPEGQDGPTTAQLQAQMQQLQAALQEAVQIGQQAQQEAEELKREKAAKDDEIQIKAFEAETKRMQVLGAGMSPEQVQALVIQTVHQALMAPPPMEPEHEGMGGHHGMHMMPDGQMMPGEAEDMPQQMGDDGAGMPDQMPAQMPDQMGAPPDMPAMGDTMGEQPED